MECSTPSSIQDIKASLGSLLIVWSRIERTLEEEIRFLHSVSPYADTTPPKHHSIAAKIRVWQGFHVAACTRCEEHRKIVSIIVERLNSALEQRNALCHGLSGYSIKPINGENHLTTTLNGTTKTYSYSNLTNACDDVNRAEAPLHELSRLSASPEATNKPARYASLLERLKIHP